MPADSSTAIVRKVADSKGYHCQVACKVPFLNTCQKKKRVDWAKDFDGVDTDEWDNPLPSDQYFTLPHEFRQTPTGMLEFHGIPSGIHQNGWNLPFCQIPMESKWDSIPTDSKFIPPDSKGHSNPFKPIP